MTRDPELMITALLDLRAWQIFDIDPAGRILAGNDERGTIQLVELGTDGSQTPLTDLPSRCSGRYVPDSTPRQVVVEHDTDGDELMQLSLLTIEPGREPYQLDELTPLVADPAYMHVLQDVSGSSVIYSTNRRNGVDMDVIVRDLASVDETILYDGGGYVVGTIASHDQQSVAVTTLSLQPASTAVFLAGARTGPITDPAEHARHTQVAWTGGDDAVIMSSNHEREFTAVVRVALDGQEWRELVVADDHDLLVDVSPDGSAMAVGHRIDGAVSISIHDADGTHRADVTTHEPGIPSVVWATDSSAFAMLISSPTDPGSIFRVDARTGEAIMISDGRAQLPGDIELSRPSVHRVSTPDGEQVPCFVHRPATGADPRLAGASVLHIHGGPESLAMQQFSPVIQVLAAVGFTVLVPNVRGSYGYGKRWVSLDDVDLRLDSVADLAALHAWLPELDLDPKRTALWGGSYGGYMVLAGVTMQPGLWAAGVDIVGISSLVTFLENTSDYRRAYREREYGSLDRDREFLIKASPNTYLDQLTSPLFIIHGANDPRVPLSEAEQISAALDERGIRNELRVYQDEGHGLAKRENRLDAYLAAIAFLTDVLAT